MGRLLGPWGASGLCGGRQDGSFCHCRGVGEGKRCSGEGLVRVVVGVEGAGAGRV